MASFDQDDELSGDRAFRLVYNSFVTMFRDGRLLAETLDWLTGHGYQVADVDAGACQDTKGLLDLLAEALDFPDYFGRNLDALNDCMRDVIAGDYGFDVNATGFVLVFRRYDVFAALEPRAAHAVLDIFAKQARDAALVGHRMMCLVQSDDPNLRFEPVGATPVLWNDAEWLHARRRHSRA